MLDTESSFVASHKSPSSQEGDDNNLDKDVNSDRHVLIGSQNTQLDLVQTLAGVSTQRLRAIEESRMAASRKVLSDEATRIIKPGIYGSKEHDKLFWVLPSDMFEDENRHIGSMLIDYANEVGATIKLVKIDYEITGAYDNNLILGIWLGLFATGHLNRRRGKKSLEKGRTMIQALLTKNIFKDHPSLGEGALVKDNFFFGNNPNEVMWVDKKQFSVDFAIKTAINSFFKDKDTAKAVFTMITQTASHVKDTYILDVEYRKLINHNIIPLDIVISRSYPVSRNKVQVSRNRTEIETKVRKPNPIRSSPLYLPDEIDLIKKLTHPIFTEMEGLHEDYLSKVMTETFPGLEKSIQENVHLRVTLLERFAKTTKERLQEVRKLPGADIKLKKAKVSTAQIEDLLKTRSDPATQLKREVLTILGDLPIHDLVPLAMKKKVSSANAEAFLYNECYSVYQTDRMRKIISEQRTDPPTQDLGLSNGNFDAPIKAVREIEKELGKITIYGGLSRVKNTKRVIGRVEDLAVSIEVISDHFSDLVKLPDKAIRISLSVATGLDITTSKALKKVIEKTCKPRYEEALNRLQWIARDSTDQKVLDDLAGLQLRLEEVAAFCGIPIVISKEN
jgi:hypothetical protein